MVGTAITIEAEGLEQLRDRINSLVGMDVPDLLENIGAEIESQTRRRIAEEKRDAEGNAWPEWSEEYAETRHSGHSLLQDTNRLLDSITYVASADQVEVGTNAIYGAIHQFGGREVGIPIPARPYLGISEENADDLMNLVEDWAEQQLGLK